MDVPTKEILNSIYFILNSSIDEIIIELILCFQYRKSLTENDLCSKQKKLSLLYKEYKYIKKLIKINDGAPPLFFACQVGYIDILKQLVENGAYINKEDNNGTTPLFIACKEGHENVVKYLLEHRANINKEDNNGWTPLMIAYQEGHENVVEYLGTMIKRMDIKRRNDVMY